MMENSDEAIERVWKGLREVEAPAGMERRILQTVRDGVPDRRGWSLASPWHLAGMRIWTIAAGVIVTSSMACWTVFNGPNRATRGNGSQSMVPESHMVGANPAAQREPMLEAGRAQPALSEKAVVQTEMKTAKTNLRRPRPVRDEGSAALHEVRYANHPAPEAPLTAQEKLLLRMAQRTAPVEIAALNPVLWAKRDEAEKVEVKKFFEQTAMGDDK